jgi:acyl dehydratase
MDIEVRQRAQRTRVVQSRDIELFTELTGDRNPL